MMLVVAAVATVLVLWAALSRDAHLWKRILSYCDQIPLPLICILLVLFVLCAGMNALVAIRTINNNGDTTHPESSTVQTAQWAAQSSRIYPELWASPYTPALYGPLFYVGVAVAGRATNGDLHEIRLLLRSIAFACFLLTGVVAYSLARRAGASRNAAILGAAVALAAPFAPYWNITSRPDFPALLLSLLGLWAISRGEQPSYVEAFLAGVFCAAAVLMKQTFIAAPLAISVLFVLRRSYRQLVVFAGAGTFTALLVVGYLLHHGEPVLKELAVVAHSPLAVGSGILLLFLYLPIGLGALVVAGACASFISALGSNRRQLQLLGCYFVFAVVVTMLTLFQVGSSWNYLFELWSVASVLAVCIIPRAEVIWKEMGGPFRVGATVGMIFLTAHSLHAIRHPDIELTHYSYDKIRALHVLSTDPSLTIEGRNPEFLDAFITTVLEERGVWSSAGLVNEINHRAFDVAFTNQVDHKLIDYHGQAILSAAVLDSLDSSYRPLCRTSTMLVMVPRERPEDFSVPDASYTLGEVCDAIFENNATAP
jgi:hypothetical protein